MRVPVRRCADYVSTPFTADASVRKINSNLEGKYRRRGNIDQQLKLFARVGVEGHQHGTSFDDSELSIRFSGDNHVFETRSVGRLSHGRGNDSVGGERRLLWQSG
jgi:hypothetical protein